MIEFLKQNNKIKRIRLKEIIYKISLYVNNNF